MFEKFKSFYNKEAYDTSQDFLDPFDYHKTFYYILQKFNVTEIGTSKPFYRNQNMYIFTVFSLSAIFAFISTLHGIYTLELFIITEAGTYVMILLYGILILSCTKLNVPQYQNLMQCIKADFYYICTRGSKYRERFLRNQSITWKICIWVIISSACAPVAMVIFTIAALLFYLVTHNPEEESQRPLLFPFWLKDINFSESPIYEIAFLFSNVAVLLYSYNFVFMLQTEIIWIRHVAAKADIVIWSIEDLLEDVHPAANAQEREYFTKLLKFRLREIVVQHQSMYSLIKDYSKVYTKCMMYEQKFCGPMVCLTAYCIAEDFDEGHFNTILILMFFATIVLSFISSYSCTYLARKVRSVRRAFWNTPFWNSVPIIRPYMVLIIQRSLRPLQLHPRGFEDFSIETFSKTLTSAYSYFNMLRQANK